MALGGLLGVIGYSSTGHFIYLAFSVILIAAGIALGSHLDKKQAAIDSACLHDENKQDGRA
jgi:hypothetical protein